MIDHSNDTQYELKGMYLTMTSGDYNELDNPDRSITVTITYDKGLPKEDD